MKNRRCLRNCSLFLLILIVLLLPACKGQATEEPQLKVTAGEQELRVIYYGDRYNETREEIDKRLKQAMEKTSVEKIPYVALGEEIAIKSENFQTEEFAISDYILKENGEIRYAEKMAQTSVIPVNGGTATITLSSHPAAFLSSNSEDYEPGKTIRGIVVRADIEGTSFAFAFIFRTDAGSFE